MADWRHGLLLRFCNWNWIYRGKHVKPTSEKNLCMAEIWTCSLHRANPVTFHLGL